MFCAIDTETGGFNAQKNALLEIAIIPLNDDFSINRLIEPFHVRIAAGDKVCNGLDPNEGLSEEEALEALFEWLNILPLELNKKVVAVGQNYQFDQRFLEEFMGGKEYHAWFARRYRDTMITAVAIEDYRRHLLLDKLFTDGVSADTLCQHYNIERKNAHTAMSDAEDVSGLYQNLLKEFHIATCEQFRRHLEGQEKDSLAINEPSAHFSPGGEKEARIRITDCSDPLFWYEDKIGKDYPVLATEAEQYKTRQDDGYINFIKKCDAILIK